MSKNNKERFYAVHEIYVKDFVGDPSDSYNDAVKEAREIAYNDEGEDCEVLIFKIVGVLSKQSSITVEKT